MKLPAGWKKDSGIGKQIIALCPHGHKQKVVNGTNVKCPTCSVSGFYKILLEVVEKITGLQWVVCKPSQHINGIYNFDIECKIGVKYGKSYDKRIKLDIEIGNKYPNIEGFQPLLEREVKSQLEKFLSSFNSDVARSTLMRVEQYVCVADPIYDEIVAMAADAQTVWDAKGISLDSLREYDIWLESTLQ